MTNKLEQDTTCTTEATTQSGIRSNFVVNNLVKLAMANMNESDMFNIQFSSAAA